MPVLIGTVNTFLHPRRDKAQAVKILEEANEVFAEWQRVDRCGCDAGYNCPNVEKLVNECADLITATCNLLDALGVDDMREAMRACEKRNRDRGRM